MAGRGPTQQLARMSPDVLRRIQEAFRRQLERERQSGLLKRQRRITWLLAKPPLSPDKLVCER
jgi:hypothetical protein